MTIAILPSAGPSKGTILVLIQEEQYRERIQRAWASRGFTVIGTDSPCLGEEILKSNPGGIAGLAIDCDFGGCGGREFFLMRLRQRGIKYPSGVMY